MNNLHITLQDFKNARSRILKTTRSLVSLGVAERIFISALYSPETMEEEVIDEKIFIKRFRLRTRDLSRNFFVQVIKYIELIKRLVKYFSDKKIGIINVHSCTLLPVGALLKRRFKALLVYDAHELETERNGLTFFRKIMNKIIERMFIKYSDITIVVSDSIADWYVEQYKIQRPYVVKNTPGYRGEIKKSNKFREYFDIPSEKTVFLYQGAFMAGRGIELLLETFKNFVAQNTVIVFMGYGPLEDKVKEAARKCNGIYYLPAVPVAEILDYTSSADFGLSTLVSSSLSYYYSLPNKFFEYMMAEIPVLVSNMKEMAKIVLEYKIGVVVENLTPQGVVDAINKLQSMNYSELQENIRRIKKEYCWEAQEKVLALAYQNLLANKGNTV
jgi:glycosyltransferase involved in cell wall biosynthesis